MRIDPPPSGPRWILPMPRTTAGPPPPAGGGPARRLAGVPGVARPSGERVIGDGLPPDLGHRGLADEDRALLAQTGNRRRVVRRRRVRREPRSEPRRHAGDENVVFNA